MLKATISKTNIVKLINEIKLTILIWTLTADIPDTLVVMKVYKGLEKKS